LEFCLEFLLACTVANLPNSRDSDELFIGIILACRFSKNCLSQASYFEMSSYSIDEGEVPHYAYPMHGFFPPFPTEIAVLYHHAETN